MISAPDAEKAVIGSMLIEREAIASCIDLLPFEACQEQQNAAILRYIYELYRDGKAVDLALVAEKARADVISIPNLMPYLAECMGVVTTAAHVAHYAKVVLERYYVSAITRAAIVLAKEHEVSSDSIRPLADLVMKKEALYAPSLVSYKTGLHDLMDKIGQRSQSSVYRTGIKSLDTAWYGMAAGEVVLVGGAPGAGKSKLALKILSNLVKRKVPSLLFGTELDAHQTTLRHLSMLSGVATWKLRIAKANAFEWASAQKTVSDVMSEMPLYISPVKHPTLADIDQGIISSGAKVVCIDSVFFCNYPKGPNIRERLEEFCRGFQAIVKRREVVGLLIAHLGRQSYAENEQTRAPRLSDFGESKGLEITADKALLMWTPQNKQLPGKRVVEVIIAKNRADNDRPGGRIQAFDLYCDEHTPDMKELDETEPIQANTAH